MESIVALHVKHQETLEALIFFLRSAARNTDQGQPSSKRNLVQTREGSEGKAQSSRKVPSERCTGCGGCHWIRECRLKKVVCYSCATRGHKARQCRYFT